MDTGLGNLNDLQNWLLPQELHDDAGFAALLPIVGTGVLGMLEMFCNRRFARVVDNVEIIPADRTKHVVERYPIEAITTLEVKQVEQDGWAVLPDLVINRMDAAGLIYFYGQQGWARGLIRLTYTGGYWYDTTEDNTGVMPDGASKLPADIKFAWLQQCLEIWKARPKLGVPVTAGLADARTQALLARSVDSLPLLPEVRALAQRYVRYQLT